MMPMLLRLRGVDENGQRFTLWLPLFLIYIMLFPLLLILLPFVLLAALIDVAFRQRLSGHTGIPDYFPGCSAACQVWRSILHLEMETFLSNSNDLKGGMMSEERKKILEMLSQNKITAEEAEKLLSAISKDSGTDTATMKEEVKYLRVMVEPGPDSNNQDRVNIRVPLKLIRAGLKLAALIPKSAQSQVNDALHEKGIEMDFSQIKPEDLENIVRQLDDLTVDVEGKESVRIFCE